MTLDDYKAAIAEYETFFDDEPAPGTPEAARFVELGERLREYEEGSNAGAVLRGLREVLHHQKHCTPREGSYECECGMRVVANPHLPPSPHPNP